MEELRFSEYCANCRKSLAGLEKLLFVEKEVGRCFCAEECIREYFQPTVEAMEEELAKLRGGQDFSEAERAQLAHYRQLALEDPDEVWMEETENGGRHFTFITHLRHGDERLSYVVVCLAIDGTPSFIFLAFPTRDDNLVDEYRRGVDMRIHEEETEQPDEEREPEAQLLSLDSGQGVAPGPRRAGDIPGEEFHRFDSFVEQTLEDPDEIWRFTGKRGEPRFAFLARHSIGEDGEEDLPDSFVMIVVCDRKLEVLFRVPTVDAGLVQHFRRGVNSLNKALGVGWARGWAA